MKKSGFTLIELMAVIVVLAVLAVVAVPIVDSLIDSVKESAYNESVKSIERATEQYILSEKSYNIDTINVTLKELVDKGYLKELPKDTLETDYVIVQKTENGYTYTFDRAN